MKRFAPLWLKTALLVCAAGAWASDAEPAKRYFAHEAVEDRFGVIAPWYRGQNGQFDFRVRVSEETLKRYPWTGPGQAVMPAPHFIFNGTWAIDKDGTISVNPDLKDWDNGDIGQRSFGLLLSQVDYYRYSGDPAAIAAILFLLLLISPNPFLCARDPPPSNRALYRLTRNEVNVTRPLVNDLTGSAPRLPQFAPKFD